VGQGNYSVKGSVMGDDAKGKFSKKEKGKKRCVQSSQRMDQKPRRHGTPLGKGGKLNLDGRTDTGNKKGVLVKK